MAIHGYKPDSQALDASGRLQLDAACHCCGYLLRGLALTSRCPECGVPVFLSLRGDRLIYASPEWLTRVGVGFRIGQIAAICLLILAFPGICFLRALGSLVPWLGAATLVLWSSGVWRATTPEPGHPVGRYRVMAAMMCGCTVIVQGFAILGVWRSWQNAWGAIIVMEWACAVGLWLLQIAVATKLSGRMTSPAEIGHVTVWTIVGLFGHGALAAGMLVGAAGGFLEQDATFVLMGIGLLITWVALIGSANVFNSVAEVLERCAMVALADRQEAIEQGDPPNA